MARSKTCLMGLIPLFLRFAASRLRAQSTNASLSGRVTDPSKAVMVGAQVAAFNASMKIGKTAPLELFTQRA